MRKFLALTLALCLLGTAALAEERDESPESAVLAAMEVYAWFAMMPLAVDEEAPGEDGATWRVLDERFDTYDELNEMALSYFSPEIVAELWALGTYQYGEDGLLYTTDAGRTMDEAIAEVLYEEGARTDERVEYRVTLSYLEGYGEDETLTFALEKPGDIWVFTEFPFFW